MKFQNSLALLVAAAGLASANQPYGAPGYNNIQQGQYHHKQPKFDDGSWYPGKYEGPGTPYDDGKWYPGKYEPKGYVQPPQQHYPPQQHGSGGHGQGHNDDDDNSLHKRQRGRRGNWDDDDDSRKFRGAAAGNSVPVLFGVGGLAAVMVALL